MSIALVVLSLGGGGIAILLSLLGAQLPAGTQYAVIVLTSLSAVALSGFIIRGLGEIKVGGAELLTKIGPVDSDARSRAEAEVGSGLRAYRLAFAGQAAAILAVVINGVMLATTLARTRTDHAGLLPLAWTVTNALLTSGSNLAGFVLFTTLEVRNGALLSQVHKRELDAKEEEIHTLQESHDTAVARLNDGHLVELDSRDGRITHLSARIRALEARLGEAGLALPVPLEAGEPTPTAATDLFRRRPSAARAAVPPSGGTEEVAETGVGAAVALTTGHS